jgi:hypothetical protein
MTANPLHNPALRTAFRRWFYMRDTPDPITHGIAAAEAVLADDERKAAMEQHPSTKRHVLIDLMDEPPYTNEWRCSCGVKLYPDCDVSRASVNECFEAHVAAAEPPARLDSDEALGVIRPCVKCGGYGTVPRWRDDDLVDLECPACMGSGRDAGRVQRKAFGS